MPGLIDQVRRHAGGIRILLRETRRWRRARERSAIRLFFGDDIMPPPDQAPHGGALKLRDLAAHFGVEAANPNLLYLVSSALPPCFGIVVRRARAAGARIVLNQNGVAYPAWHGPNWEHTNALLSIAHRAADHVFYQSAFCQDAAEQFLAPRRGSHEVLYNPVDTQVFCPSPTGRADGPLTLICAGSHHARYRVLLAIEVLAALRRRAIDARLVVAGRYRWQPDEPLCRREMADAAARLRVADRIEWAGAYTQAQAPDLLRRAHILLHACYQDACPRLGVEAMACGLPVVYSASGGTPELVGPDAGIGIPAPRDWQTVHPPDPGALCAAVLAVRDELPAYARRARERACRHFDLGPWIERHRLQFERLLQC